MLRGDFSDRYIDSAETLWIRRIGYTAGKSEELTGKFITDRHLRDRVVLATKFTFNTDPGIRMQVETGAKIFIARWKARCGG